MRRKKDFRPNILVIMTDQQRYDSLGCYGFRGIETPNLDKLAEEGVLFENCYVNNPICTPSRASIFTGKHLPDHGVYRLNDILPKDETMFTKYLLDSGYQTALIGKLHVSSAMYELDNRNKNDGFEIYDWCHEPALFLDGKYNSYGKWLRENHPDFYRILKKNGRKEKNIPAKYHATRWVAQRTSELIKKREKSKPFCFVMSIFDPHNPYTDYPKEIGNRLNKQHIRDPEYIAGETHSKPCGIIQEHENSYMGSFHDYSLQDIRKMREGYYASVAFIDDEVGRVLKTIENEGIKENTVVVFVSDHGDMLGDHELLAKGAFFYDGCTKVPLIVRYPEKISAGQKNDASVQPHDIAGTLLKIAGYKEEFIKEKMPDSMDLVQIANNDVDIESRYAMCLYRGTGICSSKQYFDPPINATMIRGRRYKLNIYHGFSKGLDDCEGELYDMENDLAEKTNLWDEVSYEKIKSEMMCKLINKLIEIDNRQNCSRGGTTKTVSAMLL